jgi:Tfp pilus assembly protein PilN
MLSFIFAILMINFLLYMHYSASNAEHAASLLLTQDEQKKTAKLESEVQAKEGFLNRYGWDRPSRISFYADRIAALVPDDAMLTALRINPLITSLLGGDGLPRFQQDTIQLSGTCDDPAELNRFANNLRNISDFREINIKSYLYKKETQQGLFSMEIITP